ncbi:MAG: hypothetical protein IKS93_03055 [Methanobrevibacter sp.]|nr:hypothetical protein [Methanobrevibacter sp.]
MRFKYLLLGLMLFIMVAGVAAADDYESLGDYTFDIPDGYQVVDKDNEMVTMQTDEDHSVIVYKLDSVSDVDTFISLLETTGCKFTDEETFQSGSFDVTGYSFTYLDIQGNLYICNDGGTPILVADAIPSSEDAVAEDSPAMQVVNSLE